uniref:Uncharacterized protein n=1 Tax=Crocodylus porosus TaxID=8502 RepID=A0A7M4F6I1_CROPO
LEARWFKSQLFWDILTSPAAYMGTITGCFLLPVKKPPHWYLNPYASWISCSSFAKRMVTYPLFTKVSPVLICLLSTSNKRFKEITSSSISRTGMEGKQASKSLSRRLSQRKTF